VFFLFVKSVDAIFARVVACIS